MTYYSVEFNGRESIYHVHGPHDFISAWVRTVSNTFTIFLIEGHLIFRLFIKQKAFNVWARYFMWNFKGTLRNSTWLRIGSWLCCRPFRNDVWKFLYTNVALTHWGRATDICVGKLTIIGSDNGLSPGRHQAIIWTNVGILLIGPLRTNFSEILIGIKTFSFKKMHLKMSSAKWRPYVLASMC